MKKTSFILVLCALLMICGCSSGPQKGEETPEPETKVVRLALNPSGHILNSIAEDQGYLRDEGITVEYVHATTDGEVFEGIRNGTIDVASNSGTNLPLQEIASGLDLTIFGGYLITGCMPVLSRVETEWHGIEDLIGKTMACEPNLYAITGPLLDMGYDPLNQIHWYETDSQEERIEAVKNGDADFALVGTSLNYAVLTDSEIKVLTYAADILPGYSCCRVEALSSWVNENPNTVKALLRAWIRAMAYYDTHHDEAIALLQKQTGMTEEFIRSYFDNPRFALNIDPMKKAVERAWDYMERLGLLGADSAGMSIDDHINVNLYKEALDECQDRYGNENPKFYEKLQSTFARNDD